MFEKIKSLFGDFLQINTFEEKTILIKGLVGDSFKLNQQKDECHKRYLDKRAELERDGSNIKKGLEGDKLKFFIQEKYNEKTSLFLDELLVINDNIKEKEQEILKICKGDVKATNYFNILKNLDNFINYPTLRYKDYLYTNIGRKRESMPQISSENIDDIILHFGNNTNIVIKKCLCKVKELLPTQYEFDDMKVLQKIAKIGDNKQKPFIISQDKHLVDSHHNWASLMEIDPDMEVTCYIINLPIVELLRRLNIMKISHNKDINDDIKKAVNTALEMYDNNLIKGEKLDEITNKILSSPKSLKTYYSNLIVVFDDKLLLLKRGDKDSFEPNKWCLPGGKVEVGETTNEGAVRETKEETGLTFDSNDITYMDEFNDKDNVLLYYLISLDTKDSLPEIVITKEHSDYFWGNINDLNNEEYPLLLDLGKHLKQILTKEDLIEKGVLNDLIKGGLQIGTIRHWEDGQYQKISDTGKDDWKKISDQSNHPKNQNKSQTNKSQTNIVKDTIEQSLLKEFPDKKPKVHQDVKLFAKWNNTYEKLKDGSVKANMVFYYHNNDVRYREIIFTKKVVRGKEFISANIPGIDKTMTGFRYEGLIVNYLFDNNTTGYRFDSLIDKKEFEDKILNKLEDNSNPQPNNIINVNIEFDKIKDSKFSTLPYTFEYLVDNWESLKDTKNDNLDTIKYFINNPSNSPLIFDNKGLADGFHRLIASKIIGTKELFFTLDNGVSDINILKTPISNQPQIKSKKSADFDSSGEWEIYLGTDKIGEIYRDTSSGYWRDVNYKPKDAHDNFGDILSTEGKGEAIEVLKENWEKNKTTKILLGEEDRIVKESNSEYEMCSCINNGKILFKQTGEKSKIYIDENNMKELFGSTFTHNHPSSRCFSQEDLLLTIRNGIKEMRAIAPKSQFGDITYVFQNLGLKIEDVKLFSAIWHDSDRIVREKNNARLDDAKSRELKEDILKEINLTHYYDLMLDMEKQANKFDSLKNKFKFYYEQR